MNGNKHELLTKLGDFITYNYMLAGTRAWRAYIPYYVHKREDRVDAEHRYLYQPRNNYLWSGVILCNEQRNVNEQPT